MSRPRRERRSGRRASRRSGRTRSSGSSAAARSRAARASSSCSRRPGGVLPRPISLCLAPRGELAFLLDPVGPGTRAIADARARRRDPRLRSARQRLPARRAAPAARRRRHRHRAAPVPLGGARAASGRARFPVSAHHAEAAVLVPNAEVVIDPVLVTECCRSAATCSPAGPSRCSRRSARSRPTRSSPGRRRWRAATAPATAASSRSTAS